MNWYLRAHDVFLKHNQSTTLRSADTILYTHADNVNNGLVRFGTLLYLAHAAVGLFDRFSMSLVMHALNSV